MEQIKMHFNHFFQFFIQNHHQITFLNLMKNQFFNFIFNVIFIHIILSFFSFFKFILHNHFYFIFLKQVFISNFMNIFKIH